MPGEKSARTTWDAVRASAPEVIVAAPCGYHLEGAAALAQKAIDDGNGPDLLMLGTTYEGRDIAARLSVAIDKPVLTNNVDVSVEGEAEGHPLRLGAELEERADRLDEDADRDRLDVDRAEGVEVGHHRVEDRTLPLRSGGEVLLEGHRRRALVRLLGAGEAAPARRARPRSHVA